MLFKNAFQKRVSKRFFVTPVEGHNFSGVLVRSDRGDDGHSVFEDVKLHLPGAVPEPVQGTLYQRNSNIAHAQEMPADIRDTPQKLPDQKIVIVQETQPHVDG